MQTNPKHIYDVFLWPLLTPWESVSKKKSHWWHWIPATLPPHATSVTLPGDSNAKSRDTSQWAMLWQTNFGWKNTAILEPNPKNIAFHVFLEKRKQKCSVILNQTFALLLGPQESTIYVASINPETPVTLTIIDQRKKTDLDPEIMLI